MKTRQKAVRLITDILFPYNPSRRKGGVKVTNTPTNAVLPLCGIIGNSFHKGSKYKTIQEL